MAHRVKVFIDYQNVYGCAREAFGDPAVDPPAFGNIRPRRLGVMLKQLGEAKDPTRKLVEVRTYRGEPGVKSHPLIQSAFAHQLTEWKKRSVTQCSPDL